MASAARARTGVGEAAAEHLVRLHLPAGKRRDRRCETMTRCGKAWARPCRAGQAALKECWGIPCYPGSTMPTPAKKAPRAGQTEKISVSLGRADLAALRKRARRLHGGNLSAAVAEGVRRIHEEEGREALVAWLGEAGEASVAERDALRTEWQGKKALPSKRRHVE
jgi:hypothetical protein